MVEWPLPPELVLGSRSTRYATARTPGLGRLLPLLRGLLFARGRRTVAMPGSARRPGPGLQLLLLLPRCPRTQDAAFVASLLLCAASPTSSPPANASCSAWDDTPTKTLRAARRGAPASHQLIPAPVRADQKFLYGHIWVTIAWLAYHPRWGLPSACPCVPWLYVRAQGHQPADDPLRGQLPRTKLEMAAEVVTWAADWLRYLGKNPGGWWPTGLTPSDRFLKARAGRARRGGQPAAQGRACPVVRAGAPAPRGARRARPAANLRQEAGN